MWLFFLRFNVKSRALPASGSHASLPRSMLLTLDIGNTRAKLVSFLDGRPRPEAVCAVAELPAALAQIGARCPSIEAVHWCSVGADIAAVEHMLSRTGWASRRLVPAAEVNGVHLDYRTPQTLGADRLAAVLGARCLQPTGHLLVIDAGTCITFDVLLADGHYVGGNISPGVDMRLAAMHAHTSRLPHVDARGELPLLGFDTPTALRSGVLRGITFEIEGYVRRLREEYGPITTFLTGGNRSDFPVSAESCTFADEYLVARGLATDF